MAGRWRGRVANLVAASPLWSPATRGRLLRLIGAHVEPGARVYPDVRFIGRVDEFSLGSGSFLNLGVVIGSGAPVTIGRRVAVGPGTRLLPTTHRLGPSGHRWGGGNVSKPIVIGEGAWIGASATILGGVTIGRGAVVAAGAVVTADCLPDRMYGGVPAKLLRTLDDAVDADATPTDDRSAPGRAGGDTPAVDIRAAQTTAADKPAADTAAVDDTEEGRR